MVAGRGIQQMTRVAAVCALFPLLASVSGQGTIVTIQPVRALTSHPGSDPWVSPDGRRVVFSRRIGDLPAGKAQLWTVPFHGGDSRLLTPVDFPYNATRPSWSPDGRLIAFRASRGTERGGIWVMSAAAEDLKPLLDDAVNDYYPRWFADGKRVLIERDVPGKEGDVWVIDVALRTARQLTSHPALDGAGTISPDETRIAFPSERSGLRNIWIMPLDEGEAGAWQFTTEGGRGPAWSPDGRWIAYGCPVAPTQHALCLKAVAGGPIRQATDGKANDFNPSWTPDGKSIVVSRIAGLTVIDVTTIVN